MKLNSENKPILLIYGVTDEELEQKVINGELDSAVVLDESSKTYYTVFNPEIYPVFMEEMKIADKEKYSELLASLTEVKGVIKARMYTFQRAFPNTAKQLGFYGVRPKDGYK
ncbi:MAG TPA: hypothetical protein PKV80_28540 [Leptospiraceae bacterium]|nr:hypothetical protein [Leptospiraceae bacterium]